MKEMVEAYSATENERSAGQLKDASPASPTELLVTGEDSLSNEPLLTAREWNTLLKLLLAATWDGYGYRPNGRTTAVADIVSATERTGHPDIIAPRGPIPVSRSTWWQGVKDGRFPQPVRLGPRVTAWRAADIDALTNAATGEPLAQATLAGRLRALKAFSTWLADRPGYRSRITFADAEYFNASHATGRVAGARRSGQCRRWSRSPLSSTPPRSPHPSNGATAR